MEETDKIHEPKLNKMIEEIINSFRDRAIFRNIFDIEKVDENTKEIEFVKIGINNLMDKVWFLPSNHLKDTYYDSDPIGRIYGSDIARAENEFLIKQLLKSINTKNNNIIASKKLKQEELDNALKILRGKGENPNIIIANSHLVNEFYNMEMFNPKVKSRKSMNNFVEGEIFDCNVYSSNDLPREVIVILDSKKIGKILLKKDLAKIADVKILDKIKKEDLNNENLKNLNLNEKINILAYEVLGMKIKDINAGLILRCVVEY